MPPSYHSNLSRYCCYLSARGWRSACAREPGRRSRRGTGRAPGAGRVPESGVALAGLLPWLPAMRSRQGARRAPGVA
jgi:hypothetical protein